MTNKFLSEIMKTSVIYLIVCCLTTAASAGMIQLVTGNNYPPFTDEKLPRRGMITEIVELAFQKVGYETTIAFRPWKRGYEETKKGVFVGTFPYIKTEERLKDFYYSQAINTVYTRVFVLRDSSIRELQDLKGQRICIPLGYGVSERFNNLLRKGFFSEEANPVNLEGCLRMMLSGRKDFFIINEINGWSTIRDTFQSKENFRTLDAVFKEETHHLIIPKTYKNSKKILEDFNIGLEKIRREGILKGVISRHLKGILD